MIDKGLRVRKGFFTAGLAAGDDISPGTSTSGGSRNTDGGSDDRREQYSVTRTQTPIKEEVKVAPISEPERDTGLERQRQKNIQTLENLKKTTYEDLNRKLLPPTNPLNLGINMLGGLIGKTGFEKNRDFFVENVAGKYGYGYELEDFEQYMEDRMSGKVGAYGNVEQGQNALRQPDDRQDTASGILEALLISDPDSPLLPTSPTGFTYVPYSNQVVVAPGREGLASLTGGQGFLSSII